MPFRCRNCNYFFSVRTGTVMYRSKIGYQGWLIAMHRVLTTPDGKGTRRLGQDLGVTEQSARLADAAYSRGVRSVAGGALAPGWRAGGVARTASMTLTSETGKDGSVPAGRSRFSLTGSATDLDMRYLPKRGFCGSGSGHPGGALSRTGKTDIKAPGVRDFPGLSTT